MPPQQKFINSRSAMYISSVVDKYDAKSLENCNESHVDEKLFETKRPLALTLAAEYVQYVNQALFSLLPCISPLN
jgi:hypothetical protein